MEWTFTREGTAMGRTNRNRCLTLRRQSGRQRPRTVNQPFLPDVWFETLESRRLMSETSTLGPDGILTIVGSDGHDEIQMSRSRVNGGGLLIVYAGAYPPPERVGYPVRD